MLAMARAMVSRPKILLESDSDSESGSVVRRSLLM
jgi:ABC-type branched-subunit amino acid transport system ATPase component